MVYCIVARKPRLPTAVIFALEVTWRPIKIWLRTSGVAQHLWCNVEYFGARANFFVSINFGRAALNFCIFIYPLDSPSWSQSTTHHPSTCRPFSVPNLALFYAQFCKPRNSKCQLRYAAGQFWARSSGLRGQGSRQWPVQGYSLRVQVSRASTVC